MVLNTWLKPTDSIPSIKGVAVGLAGQRAVECAEMAALGITASDDALEVAMSTPDRSRDQDAELPAIARLGSCWTTHRHVIKSYPSQIYTQAAVQAALGLRGRVNSVDEIDSITLFGHRNVCAGVQGSPPAFRPLSREAADHSTPFVMAMALMNGEVTLRAFEGEPWLRADVRSVMDRIRLIVDTERDRSFVDQGLFGVLLEADLSGGRSEAIEVLQPKGHPDDPMSDDELITKMSWLLEGIVDDRVPADLFDICMNMISTSDLNRLTDLCTVGPS